jgi:hypothetical protein
MVHASNHEFVPPASLCHKLMRPSGFKTLRFRYHLHQAQREIDILRLALIVAGKKSKNKGSCATQIDEWISRLS